MAKRILQYDMLISCPSDAADAVSVIREVVDEFNQQFTDALGIGIRLRYWQFSAFAESGGKPQEMLNKQIVDSADLAVAIFKTRFGSPTEKYGSGTEEEIENMISQGKQVFMFFDESPVNPVLFDSVEYEKVRKFKSRYKDKGIYWNYKSLDEFKSLFRAHVTMYFMTLHKETKLEKKPVLVLKAFNNGIVEGFARIKKFDMGGFISYDLLKNRIINEIGRISEMSIVKSVSNYGSLMATERNVMFEDNTIAMIKAVAAKWNVEITEEFFYIGELRESMIFNASFFGGERLIGTQEEKDKYHAILSLQDNIYTLMNYAKLEEYYGSLCGIELLISNDGTNYDEDIDVDLHIPRERYIDIVNFPVPNENIDRNENWSFPDVFTIQSTKDFISYIDTKKGNYYEGVQNFYNGDIFGNRDYEEEYREMLCNAYEYSVYNDGADVILRVHFDYLKQHQTAAFPTWIFIDDSSRSFVIKYRITSKKNKEIIERDMEIISMES